jgi:hypothetical protein
MVSRPYSVNVITLAVAFVDLPGLEGVRPKQQRRDLRSGPTSDQGAQFTPESGQVTVALRSSGRMRGREARIHRPAEVSHQDCLQGTLGRQSSKVICRGKSLVGVQEVGIGKVALRSGPVVGVGRGMSRA